MNHTFLGQVRQEGCWVPIYDFSHRVGADALILADKSIYSCQGFVKMLDGENDTEFSTATLLRAGTQITLLWLPPYLPVPLLASITIQLYFVAGFASLYTGD